MLNSINLPFIEETAKPAEPVNGQDERRISCATAGPPRPPARRAAAKAGEGKKHTKGACSLSRPHAPFCLQFNAATHTGFAQTCKTARSIGEKQQPGTTPAKKRLPPRLPGGKLLVQLFQLVHNGFQRGRLFEKTRLTARGVFDNMKPASYEANFI